MFFITVNKFSVHLDNCLFDIFAQLKIGHIVLQWSVLGTVLYFAPHKVLDLFRNWHFCSKVVALI